MALAAALRAWRLWEIPSPTDEIQGVERGLQIARGELFPLTDWEPYIGAFWNYVLALGFLVAGPSEYVGRTVPLIVGVLTVPAAYLLGRELGGRGAGLVAAALVATSAVHILATSHPAWSHCFAPLLLTLGLWQMARCLKTEEPRNLLAAAFWLGLSVQIHLTMLASLPGIAAALLSKRPQWLRTPWPYVSALICLALVSNLLVFNVLTGFETIRRTGVVQDAYATARSPIAASFVDNAQSMGVTALRILGGAIEIRENPSDYATDPVVLAQAALALLGLLLLLARRNLLPLLVTASYVPLMLYFNAKYEVIPNSRFVTPLLPLAAVCSGVALTNLAARISAPMLARISLVALATLGMSAYSLRGLAERYSQMEASAQTTAQLRAAVDFVERELGPAPYVLLDRNLDRLWLDGGGDVRLWLNYELYRRLIPFGELPSRVIPPTGDTNPCAPQWLIATLVDRSVATPRWLASGFRSDPGTLPTRFWTFRVTPRRAEAEMVQARGSASERVVLAYTPPLSASARAVNRCAPGRQI